jgi:hypothetical protein
MGALKTHFAQRLWPFSLAASGLMAAGGVLLKQHWLLALSNVVINLGFMAKVVLGKNGFASALGRAFPTLASSPATGRPSAVVQTLYRCVLAAMTASILLGLADAPLKPEHVRLVAMSMLLAALGGALAILPLLAAWIALADTSAQAEGAPPRSAKLILLLIPIRDREHLAGDLEEEYREIVLPQYGAGRACLWYWWQVAASITPMLWSQAKRVAWAAFLLRFLR